MTDNQRFESNNVSYQPDNSVDTRSNTVSQPQGYPYSNQLPNMDTSSTTNSYVVEPVVAQRKSRGLKLVAWICLICFILSSVLLVLIRFYPHKSAFLSSFVNEQQLKQDSTTDNNQHSTGDGKTDNNQEDLGNQDSSTANSEDTSVHNRSFSLAESAKRKDVKNLSIPELVEKNKDGVVAITSDQEIETVYGVMTGHPKGSGFIISDDGYVVTNNHVVNNTKNNKVVLADGSIKAAELVGTDPLNDIAVLKMEGSGYKTVPLGDSDDVQVGELAVAIGNPSGNLSGTVTAGIVSALEREINVQGLNMTLLQTDAAINEGNSGGALFNSRGQVIGINTVKLSLSGSGHSVYEGLGFAIPINIAKPVIEDLIKYGYVKDRVYLGIKGIPAGRQLYIGPNDFGGVYVAEVIDNSPAAKAGIQPGDIIVKFKEERVQKPIDINNLIKDIAPNTEVAVSIVRDNKIMELKVQLEAVNHEAK